LVLLIMAFQKRETQLGDGEHLVDTALALDSTQSRDFFLSRLRMDVDALSHSYSDLRKHNDRWNQLIMVISALGALITSILTIAGMTGWPFEIVPIVIQTSSGVMAAWMRFYDFPKRMEAIINTKHTTNDIRERLEKSPTIDENLWEQYCSSVKNLDNVLTPQERDYSHVLALKYMKKERVREAQLHMLLNMTNDELLASCKGKKKDKKDKGSDDGSSSGLLSPIVRSMENRDVPQGFSQFESAIEDPISIRIERDVRSEQDEITGETDQVIEGIQLQDDTDVVDVQSTASEEGTNDEMQEHSDLTISIDRAASEQKDSALTEV